MGLVLSEKNLQLKLAAIELAVHQALLGRPTESVPVLLGRDVLVLGPQDLPEKKGLSQLQGQARLLHDLASIELQAMELALRTLIEFPEAPMDFREQLADLTLNEADHLRLCLRSLEESGGHWGQVPVHIGLWQAVSSEDSLLDRVLIVHRYLEGSGLDAGETLLRRLEGMAEGPALRAMRTIHHEELAHVQFGSFWYRRMCQLQKLDADHDFIQRMETLGSRLPKRLEPVKAELRYQAGFSEQEVNYLQQRRSRFLLPRAESATGPRANLKV